MPPTRYRVGKDPRFEDLSGAYNPDRFRKQYAFLYEQQLPAEKSGLKAAMKVRKYYTRVNSRGNRSSDRGACPSIEQQQSVKKFSLGAAIR